MALAGQPVDNLGPVLLTSRIVHDEQHAPSLTSRPPNSFVTTAPEFMPDLWARCQAELRDSLSEQQFRTWIKPLEAIRRDRLLLLSAPNRFVLEWVRERFLRVIEQLTATLSGGEVLVELQLSADTEFSTERLGAAASP